MDKAKINDKIRKNLHKHNPLECWSCYVMVSSLKKEERDSLDHMLLERLKSFLRVNNYPVS